MKKKNGFTLIELGIVISAISVLAASTMTYSGFRKAAVHTQVRKALSDIRMGTVASLSRVSVDDASSYSNWLTYLADNDFIATGENYAITFDAGVSITHAAIVTNDGPAFLLVLISGFTDIASEDILNAEANVSSYYEDAQFLLCNQKIPGIQLIILCYHP